MGTWAALGLCRMPLNYFSLFAALNSPLPFNRLNLATRDPYQNLPLLLPERV